MKPSVNEIRAAIDKVQRALAAVDYAAAVSKIYCAYS